MERHRVGSVSAVRPNGLSDGCGEFGKHALGWRRGFNPIESSSDNQSGDDLDFALSAPRPVAKAEAKLCGFEDAFFESGAQRHRWPPRSLIGMRTWTVAQIRIQYLALRRALVAGHVLNK